MITNPVHFHLRCVTVEILLKIGLLCEHQWAHNIHNIFVNDVSLSNFFLHVYDYVLRMKCNPQHKLPPLPLCSTDSHWQWTQEHIFEDDIRLRSYP